MNALEMTDRLLFLRYAVPCAGTLVQRGTMEQQAWDELIAAVHAGNAPPDAEKLFKVAYAACSLLALDGGKKAIDSPLIRYYFRAGHDAVIDARYAEMQDFDPEACRVWAGAVTRVAPGKAWVLLPHEERECRTDFVPAAKPGDWVVVHWGFMVEPVTEKEAAQINGRGAKSV